MVFSAVQTMIWGKPNTVVHYTVKIAQIGVLRSRLQTWFCDVFKRRVNRCRIMENPSKITE